MKRIQLIAAALCLIMLTTVGAGVVVAKQTENPRHAGTSHIYFYDVQPTDSHGTGKLQINLDKHTFVFNGQGFTPSQQIALMARAAGDTKYKVFATGKASPSGNLHIAGTWEKDATPVDVVADVGCFAYYDHLVGFLVTNDGGFVAKIACYYSTDCGVTWTESGHTSGIPIARQGTARLGSLGVPDGALVKVHVIVVGGNDKTGSEVYQYTPYQGSDSGQYAYYSIKGTTLNNILTFLDYSCCI